MVNPIKFFNEVKAEGSKVTWPTRAETISVTIVVLIMVGIAAVFFMAADWVIYNALGKILGY